MECCHNWKLPDCTMLLVYSTVGDETYWTCFCRACQKFTDLAFTKEEAAARGSHGMFVARAGYVTENEGTDCGRKVEE